LCPYTKKPIAAPSHHSYKKLLNEHYMMHIYGMPFDRFCDRLETSSAPEDIQTWLDEMKQKRSFKIKKNWNTHAQKAGFANDGLTEADSLMGESSNAPEVEAIEEREENPGATQDEVLQSLVEVFEYLKQNGNSYVHQTECVRVPGTSLENIHDRDLRNFIRYHLSRQQRFPLETASGMRSKFKQNNLYSYKCGKKGISYVCATPRKFRDGESHLTDKLELILNIVEKFPLLTAGAVAEKVVSDTFAAGEVASLLTWLIREGYVTEFEDGTLMTHTHQPKWGSEQHAGNPSAPQEYPVNAGEVSTAATDEVDDGTSPCACEENSEVDSDAEADTLG
jgi:hypothetical protein